MRKLILAILAAALVFASPVAFACEGTSCIVASMKTLVLILSLLTATAVVAFFAPQPT